MESNKHLLSGQLLIYKSSSSICCAMTLRNYCNSNTDHYQIEHQYFKQI